MSIGVNPNWGRWIYSSVLDSFLTEFNGTPGIQLFVEGTHRERPSDVTLYEFRLDGPTIKRPSKGCFVLEVDVNIFIQVAIEQGTFGNIRQHVGEVQEWIGQNFCITKRGSGPQDDGTHLGELTLQGADRLDGIRSHFFGQIDEPILLEQASVEASYELSL